MAEIAGFNTLVRVGGATTAMIDEACNLVATATRTYEITDPARRVLDPDVAVVVEDNGTPVAASDIEQLDFLTGRVVFDSAYVITGPITITGNFIPTVVVACAKTWQATHSREIIESTCFGATARDKFLTIKEATGSISEFDDGYTVVGPESFNDKFEDADIFVLEFDPDGTGAFLRRYFVALEGMEQAAEATGLVEDTLTWSAVGKQDQNGGFQVFSLVPPVI